MAKQTAWNITTKGSRPLEDVVKDLEDAGLEDLQVLEQIGVVSGSGDEECAARMRKVADVAAVEPDLSVDIGLPGEGETW